MVLVDILLIDLILMDLLVLCLILMDILLIYLLLMKLLSWYWCILIDWFVYRFEYLLELLCAVDDSGGVYVYFRRYYPITGSVNTTTQFISVPTNNIPRLPNPNTHLYIFLIMISGLSVTQLLLTVHSVNEIISSTHPLILLLIPWSMNEDFWYFPLKYNTQ